MPAEAIAPVISLIRPGLFAPSTRTAWIILVFRKPVSLAALICVAPFKESIEGNGRDLRRRGRPAPSGPMRQTADCGLPLRHPRALGGAEFNPQRRRLH